MTYEEIRARMAAEYAAQAGFAPDDASDAGIRIRWKKAFQSVCLEVVETTPDAPAS